LTIGHKQLVLVAQATNVIAAGMPVTI